MIRELVQHDLDMLENLVDNYRLTGVLAALATVADAKAQHAQEAWQDGRLSREWSQCAKKLEAVTDSVNKLNPASL